jgi:hypothetical protein
MSAGTFAATGLALYVGHHVGDYWVQTDHQARTKGQAGKHGRTACFDHVLSYTATQMFVFVLVMQVLDLHFPHWWTMPLALAVSGGTHYMADRREHGLMFWVARKLGKGSFMKLGVPREGIEIPQYPTSGAPEFVTDNPQLATGAWALDQSWHLFFGVLIPALIIAS